MESISSDATDYEMQLGDEAMRMKQDNINEAIRYNALYAGPRSVDPNMHITLPYNISISFVCRYENKPVWKLWELYFYKHVVELPDWPMRVDNIRTGYVSNTEFTLDVAYNSVEKSKDITTLALIDRIMIANGFKRVRTDRCRINYAPVPETMPGIIYKISNEKPMTLAEMSNFRNSAVHTHKAANEITPSMMGKFLDMLDSMDSERT